MKHLFPILLTLSFSLHINMEVFAWNTNADTLTQSKLRLTNDSGFVTMKEGLEFLLANSLTDTTPYNHWQWCKNDIIGRYYRIGNTNHYMMCLLDMDGDFGSDIIIEITSNGELVKNERFYHGNYSCCWSNNYDAFSKYGDFFGIQICGTGSGYCSSDLYLFKEVTPQDTINPIPFYCWDVPDGNDFFYFRTSIIDIKKDELVFHYIKETGILKYNEQTDDWDIKVHHRNKFKIKYFYENEKWHTKDIKKIEKLKPLVYKLLGYEPRYFRQTKSPRRSR